MIPGVNLRETAVCIATATRPTFAPLSTLVMLKNLDQSVICSRTIPVGWFIKFPKLSLSPFGLIGLTRAENIICPALTS